MKQQIEVDLGRAEEVKQIIHDYMTSKIDMGGVFARLSPEEVHDNWTEIKKVIAIRKELEKYRS